MPPLETTDRKQYAVLWEFTGQDSYGQPVVMQPVELLVRWLDKITQVADPTGNTVQSNAQIITGRSIALQSILWKGRLRDLPSPPYTGLHLLIGDNTTPDIKNRNQRFEYSLMRWKQQLPTVTGTSP